MNSLKVGEEVMNAMVDGSLKALLIVESWKFHEPVIQMTKEELEEASERCRTTFNFPRIDSKGGQE